MRILLQASLHLERLGDLAVYLGKTTQEIFDSPVPETVHATVVEMGDLVIDMTSSAMESLKNRDKDLALATAAKDNQVNRLYNTRDFRFTSTRDSTCNSYRNGRFSN